MNEICRLCLTVPSHKMCELTEESDILSKVWSSMSIQIFINKSLPNKVCNVCTKKIYEIYEFHKEITENEQKLLNYLRNDRGLDNFYCKLKTTVKVKEEMPQTDIDSSDHENVENYLTDPSDQLLIPSICITKCNSVKKPKHALNSVSRNKCIVKSEIDSEDEVSLKELKEREPKSKDNCKLNLKVEQRNCLTCFQYCDSQDDLIKHYQTEHNNEVHEEKIDEDKTLICNGSGKTLEKKQSDRPYVCKLCGRTFITVHAIVRHGRVHNGYKLFCSFQCGYSTVYKGSLKDHEMRRHIKSGHKYKCEKCGKGFIVKTWYEQHQNVHKNLKPFICEICGLAFHMHRYLTTHRSIVHPQTSTLKRYKCVLCLLPCDSKNSLRLHMEEHGIKAKFLCDMCGKVCSNAEQLKYHKNVHLGVKPYSCSICTKTFTKKFNMKQHERTHTGERSHACDVCGKCYVQRSALRRHSRSHHAE